MNVVAFSTPRRPDWHWRIVNYGGETIEESSAGFTTIALAVAEGNARLQSRVDRDLPVPKHAFGPPSWRRRR
jgi:hypothetical protein